MRQLLYVSTSTITGDQSALDDILLQSRHNCALDGLTGVLWVAGDRFLQLLEGEDDAVEATMARIRRDPRHRDLRTPIERTIERREFQSWSMLFRHRGESEEAFALRVRAIVARASPAVTACFEDMFAAGTITAPR